MTLIEQAAEKIAKELESEKVNRIMWLLREKDGVEKNYNSNVARIDRQIKAAESATTQSGIYVTETMCSDGVGSVLNSCTASCGSA